MCKSHMFQSLISTINKGFSKLNSKNKNGPIIRWAKHVDIYFTEKNIRMANKHTKRFLTSLAISETEVKTMMRCHFKPVRTTKKKNFCDSAKC